MFLILLLSNFEHGSTWLKGGHGSWGESNLHYLSIKSNYNV